MPVVPVGRLTLNRNPDNFFAETEQVAFHTGHVVPGIDFTNDPLLQGRLFSYIDTQLRRVGPNFHELPINRSLRPADNNQRDGFARMTINKGRVSYFPNSLGGGCPMHSPAAAAAFRSVAVKEQAGPKVRERSPSFSDHFSQATQFWNSMSDWEKDHIAAAFAFELNQVVDEVVRDRTMNEILVNIHEDLAAMVSEATGIAVEPAGTPEAPTPSAPTPAGPLRKDAGKLRSPALSMDKPPPTIKGRKVAVLVGDGVDTGEVEAMLEALSAAELVPETIGPRAGTVAASGEPMKVNRAAPNAPSVVYDAVLVPSGVGPALAAQTAGAALRPRGVAARQADRRRAGCRGPARGGRRAGLRRRRHSGGSCRLVGPADGQPGPPSLSPPRLGAAAGLATRLSRMAPCVRWQPPSRSAANVSSAASRTLSFEAVVSGQAKQLSSETCL